MSLTLVSEKHIFKFQISVNDVPIVTLLNAECYLAEPLLDLLFVHSANLFKMSFHLTTLAVFHDENHLVVDDEVIVDVHHILALHALQCLRLLTNLKSITRF